jgi:hypothetical protein
MNLDDTWSVADRAEAEARVIANVMNDLATRTAKIDLGTIATKKAEAALAILVGAEQSAWSVDCGALSAALKASNEHSSVEISETGQ